MSADSASRNQKAGGSAAAAGPEEPEVTGADAQDDGQPGNSGYAAGGTPDGQAAPGHNMPTMASQPVAAADLLQVARQVAAQQAGKWSAGEQQRWWQHLQAAVGGQPGAQLVADAAQQIGGGDVAGPGSAGMAADPTDANPSGLTHSDRTTHSDRSLQGKRCIAACTCKSFLTCRLRSCTIRQLHFQLRLTCEVRLLQRCRLLRWARQTLRRRRSRCGQKAAR